MIDASWEGKVQFYELAFGTWIAYLFLVCMWGRLFRTRHDGWRYALITLIGGSFYIINHYFQHAPFYSLLINSYTIVFSVAYYVILVKPLDCSGIKKVFFFLSSLLFTIVYIGAESLARFLKEGKIIPGIYIPEFLLLLISFIACIFIILSKRHSNTDVRSHTLGNIKTKGRNKSGVIGLLE
jgi:hypothetical protein